MNRILSDRVVNIEILRSLSINVKEYPQDGLYVLNYSQYNSPKFNGIADKCRGLIVDKNFSPVSLSFDRFYNYGENPNQREIENFYAMEKVDGSLIKVYFFHGKWNISTRGTAFGENYINESLLSLTYEEAIRPFVESMENKLSKELTYIFEFCSPLNRIVVDYGDKERIFYLMSRDNKTGEYINQRHLFRDKNLPKLYRFKDLKSCVDKAKSINGLDEGFVIYDSNTNKPLLKIKNPRYVSLHHKKTNGKLTLKNIISLYLSNEIDEYVAYFPSDKPTIDKFLERVEKHFSILHSTHEENKNLTRKEYAKKCPSFLGFKSLDNGLEIRETFNSLSLEQQTRYLENKWN